MAEITLGALALTTSASFSGKTKRILTSKSTLNGQASVSSRFILIVKERTLISGIATSNVNTRLIKYVNTTIQNDSDTMGKSYKYKTVRAIINGDSTLEAFTFHRDIHADIHTYLPSIYNDLDDVQLMLDVEASEVIRIQAKLYELLDQFYVNSATYGLERWESEVGIEAIPQRSTDSRRHYINAKLRGTGTVTAELLKSVVDAFYYSEITDKPREYTVAVKLLGKRGVPKNLEDIEVAVNDVIPAHLRPEYEFTFATWGEINSVGLTWQEADEKTLEEFEETFYVDPGYPHEE